MNSLLTFAFFAFLVLLAIYVFIPSITMLAAQDPTGAAVISYATTLVLPVLAIIAVAIWLALRAVKRS